MSICKVALANLGMRVRDHYFPASYAHASWQRLQVFFQLPGRISWGTAIVEVEPKRFNDRTLNRDWLRLLACIPVLFLWAYLLFACLYFCRFLRLSWNSFSLGPDAR